MDSAAFGALVAFFALMYAGPAEWMEPLEWLRPALLTSTGALALLAIAWLVHRQRLTLDGWRGGALLLFAGLALASRAWALNPEGSTALAVECFKYAGIYLTTVNLARTPRRMAILCGALVIASLVPSIGGIRWYLGGVDLVEGYRARWRYLFADPNRMAMTLGLVMPLALGFAVRRATSVAMRVVAIAALALGVAAIVVSFSRGGFIGLMVATGLWLVLERRFDRTALVGAAALVLLALAPGSFWTRTETVSQFHEDASAMGRVHAWTVASRINMDRPLLGVGAGSFRTAWPRYAPPEAAKAFEAHNVFLQVLAELGWVGFFLYLGFLGSAVQSGVRASRDPDVGWMARALVAGSVGYLVCSVSAGFISGAPFLYAVLAAAVSAGRFARAASPDPALVLEAAPGTPAAPSPSPALR